MKRARHPFGWRALLLAQAKNVRTVDSVLVSHLTVGDLALVDAQGESAFRVVTGPCLERYRRPFLAVVGEWNQPSLLTIPALRPIHRHLLETPATRAGLTTKRMREGSRRPVEKQGKVDDRAQVAKAPQGRAARRRPGWRAASSLAESAEIRSEMAQLGGVTARVWARLGLRVAPAGRTPPPGVEPGLQVPETCVISLSPRGPDGWCTTALRAGQLCVATGGQDDPAEGRLSVRYRSFWHAGLRRHALGRARRQYLLDA